MDTADRMGILANISVRAIILNVQDHITGVRIGMVIINIDIMEGTTGTVVILKEVDIIEDIVTDDSFPLII